MPDIMHGVTASIDEPIAGGRHKVFGHHDLAVIPQTSTIASHLPRAVGVAIAIDRARKLGVECTWPSDAIVVCSFGDASLNHATAQAALNTTSHAAHQHLPVPLLFVCEDNGLGISVPSPDGVGGRDALEPPRPALRERPPATTRKPFSRRLRPSRPGCVSTGAPLSSTFAPFATWVMRARTWRPPTAHRTTCARISTVTRSSRLHDGSWRADSRTGNELADEYLESRAHVREVALDAARRPQLGTATEVIRPLASHSPERRRRARARHTARRRAL